MFTPKDIICHLAPAERRRSIACRGLITLSWTGSRLVLYGAPVCEALPWRDVLALRAKRKRVEYHLWIIDPRWLWREPLEGRVVTGTTVTNVYQNVPPEHVYGPGPTTNTHDILTYVRRVICDVSDL